MDLATFVTAGILIGKVKTPTDKLLAVNSRIKTLDQTMTRMHKVLMLDEIQKNAVEKVDASTTDIALSIKGSFSWKLGEKDKDQTEFDEPIYGGRGMGRLGRGGGRGGRRGAMRRFLDRFQQPPAIKESQKKELSSSDDSSEDEATRNKKHEAKKNASQVTELTTNPQEPAIKRREPRKNT